MANTTVAEQDPAAKRTRKPTARKTASAPVEAPTTAADAPAPAPTPADHRHCLTEAQRAVLLQAIDPSRVKTEAKMAHVEGWDVRRWLIRIFGFTGWGFQILETVMAFQGFPPDKDTGEKRVTVVYRVTGRLKVKCPCGEELTSWDDGACGAAVNFRMSMIGDAHDFAVKTANTQSLKRCAVNLGDMFGMSLYNESSRAPVVNSLLMDNPTPVTLPNDPPVQAEPTPIAAAIAEADRAAGALTAATKNPQSIDRIRDQADREELLDVILRNDDDALTLGERLTGLQAAYFLSRARINPSKIDKARAAAKTRGLLDVIPHGESTTLGDLLRGLQAPPDHRRPDYEAGDNERLMNRESTAGLTDDTPAQDTAGERCAICKRVIPAGTGLMANGALLCEDDFDQYGAEMHPDQDGYEGA